MTLRAADPQRDPYERRPPMPPVQIRLSGPQIAALDALSRRTGLLRSEIMRRAIDDYVRNWCTREEIDAAQAQGAAAP